MKIQKKYIYFFFFLGGGGGRGGGSVAGGSGWGGTGYNDFIYRESSVGVIQSSLRSSLQYTHIHNDTTKHLYIKLK